MNAMVIESVELSKEYGSQLAVDKVTLALPEASVLALVGPNGAGKTTWLRMLAGLIEPTSGTARIGGLDLVRQPRLTHKNIGFLPDFFGLYSDLRVDEYLEYFARAYDLPSGKRASRITTLLQELDLEHKRRNLITELSRGMRQRLAIARALIHDPPVLLLDEPASGLDPDARHSLNSLFLKLAAQGKTLIVSSHILTELEEYSSHVAMIKGGKLQAFGAVKELKTQASDFTKIVVQLSQNAIDLKGQLHLTGLEFELLSDTSFTINGPQTPMAQTELLQKLIASGLSVCHFAPFEHRLNDIYLEITKRGQQS
jgi:ABC-2 type transport system ATP-binding protein